MTAATMKSKRRVLGSQKYASPLEPAISAQKATPKKKKLRNKTSKAKRGKKGESKDLAKLCSAPLSFDMLLCGICFF